MLGWKMGVVLSRASKHTQEHQSTHRSSMKKDLLNALLMILIISTASNTTAANTLITKAYVEFQGKKCNKKMYSFQSAIKSKSISIQVSI